MYASLARSWASGSARSSRLAAFPSSVAAKAPRSLQRAPSNQTRATAIGGHNVVARRGLFGFFSKDEKTTEKKKRVKRKPKPEPTTTDIRLLAKTGPFYTHAQPSSVIAWGRGKNNMLGFADGIDQVEPTFTPIAGEDGAGVTSIAYGKEMMAFVSGGKVYTVGYGKNGQLGQGKDVDRQETPKMVEGIDEVVQVVCSSNTTAAVNKNGDVYTWGWGGNVLMGAGALGHGDREDVWRPKRVKGLIRNERVVQIAVGKGHMGAVTREGACFMWGNGKQGIHGTGTTSDRLEPAPLADTVDKVAFLACGGEHSVVIDAEGKLWGWGKNTYAQITGAQGAKMGDPTSSLKAPGKYSFSSSGEEKFEEDISWVHVACNSRSTLMISSSGRAYMGGAGRAFPTTLQGPGSETEHVKFIWGALGKGYCQLIASDGSLWSFGANGDFQLGHPKKFGLESSTPRRVMGFGDHESDKFGRALIVAPGPRNCAVLSQYPTVGDGETPLESTSDPAEVRIELLQKGGVTDDPDVVYT